MIALLVVLLIGYYLTAYLYIFMYGKTKKEFLLAAIPFYRWIVEFKDFWKRLE